LAEERESRGVRSARERGGEPFTVVAEFRHGLNGLLGPSAPGASLIASRYLMGGGGWVIALTAAIFCIALARRSRAKGVTV
jgi:hypothetical protein